MTPDPAVEKAKREDSKHVINPVPVGESDSHCEKLCDGAGQVGAQVHVCQFLVYPVFRYLCEHRASLDIMT